MTDIQAEIGQVTSLITLPEIYLQLRELMADEAAGIDDFARLIVVDPNLSSRVLRMVNSACFGLPEPVDSITRAINLIGISRLHDLALGASAMTGLDLPNEILPLKPFWRNSLFTGVLAQQLAEQLGLERSDRLFIAGLLHDIGNLVICARLPEYAREASRHAVQAGLAQHEAQRYLLGLHYGEIGALLLAQWNLPPALQDLVRFQPEPLASPAPREPAALLHLAHASASQPGLAEADVDTLVAAPVRALIGLGSAQIADAVGTAREIGNEVGAGIFG